MRTAFYIRKLIIAELLALCLAVCMTACGNMGESSSTQVPEANQTQISTEVPTQTPVSTPTQAPTQTPTQTPTQRPTVTPDVPTSNPIAKKQYHIEVSLAAQIVYIYDVNEFGEKGNLVKTFLCSTGRAGEETPMRKWVILDSSVDGKLVQNKRGLSHYKFEWLNGVSAGQYMTRMWIVETDGNGNEYFINSNYLFHSAPYLQIDKNALDTPAWNKLGVPDSAGCVRLTVEDAKWIYDHAAPYTYVYTVEGTPDPELWATLKHPELSLDITRDPTDIF